MTKKSVLILFFLSIISASSISQFYQTGEDPSRIKWNNINTLNFEIIFPIGYSHEAQRLANILDKLYQISIDSLKLKPKKISVVVHNQSNISNGMVIWAPRRMELYPSISNKYSDNNIRDLAVHEFQHVLQISGLNNNLIKYLTYFFGEQAIGLAASLYPLWYYEGGAVFMESKYSNFGRGNLPSFQMTTKAAFSENKKKYSFDQAMLGSYKKIGPTWYEAGYNMMNYCNNNFNDSIWQKTNTFVTKYPFTIIPFYFSLKKQTGLTKEELYNEAHKQYLNLPTKTIANKNITQQKDSSLKKERIKPLYNKQTDKNRVLNEPLQFLSDTSNKHYTNYKFPKYVNESTIIALKTSIEKTPEIVIIKNGYEIILTKTGFYYNDCFTYNNELLMWGEQIFDPRWAHRDYISIISYDLRTNKKQIFLKNTRYVSLSLSPDNNKICAIKADENNIYSIAIINVKTKNIIREIQYSYKNTLHNIIWTTNNKIIYVKANEKGSFIEEINPEDLIVSNSYSFGKIKINNPVNYNNYIIFDGDVGNSPNIFALNKSNSKTYKLTNSQFGAFNASINLTKNSFIFEDYHFEGKRICEMIIDSNKFSPIVIKNNDSSITKLHFNNEERFEEEKYNKLSHLINIHSWAPFYINYNEILINPIDINVLPGISLLSQNKLSTFTTTAGYAYKNNNNLAYLNFSYSGLYPVFDFKIEYESNPLYISNQPINENLSLQLLTYLPLQFNKHHKKILLTPYFRYKKYIYQNFNSGIETKTISRSYIQSGFSFLHYTNLAHREIYPKWGQYISIYSKYIPLFTQPDLNYYLDAGLFFPGFLNNHSLNINTKFVFEEKKYHYSNITNTTLGNSYKLTDKQLFTKANYTFPIVEPDYNIKWLCYIKRTYGNLFLTHRYALSFSDKFDNEIYTRKHDASYGFELLNNVHFLRIYFPIEIGLRFSHMYFANKNKLEFIFDFDLNYF